MRRATNSLPRCRGSVCQFPTGCLAALLFWLLAVEVAQAGAFNLPQGDGLLITDVTFSGGSRYFNGLGRMVSADRFRQANVSAYVEYGVTDWLMAVVQPDLTGVSLRGAPGGHYLGLGPSEAGAQVRLLTFGRALAAVAGAVIVPGSTDRTNRALLGNTSHDADLRALFGYSFALGAWPAFVDAQAAYRFRDQGAPDEVHADLTLGVRPLTDLQILAQVFDTIGLGRGTVWFPKQRYAHVGGSLVYDVGAAWSVQLGAFTTVFGRRSLREQGLTTAVWYRF